MAYKHTGESGGYGAVKSVYDLGRARNSAMNLNSFLRPTIFGFFAAVCFAAAAGFVGFTSTGTALILACVTFLIIGSWGLRQEREATAGLRLRERETLTLEARLQEQQRTVDTLADGLDAALFIANLRGQILYANPPAHRLFGNESPRGQMLLAATLSIDLEKLLLSAVQQDEPARGEIAFTYPHEWIGLASAWRDLTGDRVFVSVYEITELRRLERSRRDFVANVSHELRTPMTIIRSYAETLLDENPPTAEMANRMLPRIISEVDRLSTISQDLLVLTVAESNPVRKQRCDLAEVVREVVHKLQEKATEKGLTLTYEGDESLPMQANDAQMTQVAINLVDNAINYTPSGSVRASLTREGEKAVLVVKDTGIGIATEHVERVFERFYRVDRGRSRATGGTGLGLSIVRHIVEAHGGHLSLDSALNKGSTFRVELPVE